MTEVQKNRESIPKVLLKPCKTPVADDVTKQSEVALFMVKLWSSLEICKIKHDAIRELEEIRVKADIKKDK